MINKYLKKLGLNDKEIRVYLAILELGDGSISDIARKSDIKRTSAYLIMENLISLGLVSQTKKSKRALYVAENPNVFIDNIEEKKIAAEKAMPELLAIAGTLEKKPKIRYFQGDNGIKEVYKDTLRFSNQEILAWPSEEALNFDKSFFDDFYFEQRRKKKIWVRAISVETEVLSKYALDDQKQLRQSKFVSSEEMPFQVEINLYGKNKVAFMAYKEKIGVIIESEKIFNTLKSIFEIMWKMLK